MGDFASLANLYLLVAWFLVAVGGIWLFFICKRVSLKRRLHGPYIIGVGILFIGYIALVSNNEVEFIFATVIIAFVTVINMRTIAFCDNCGATAFSQNPFLFSRPTHCQKCGQPIEY